MAAANTITPLKDWRYGIPGHGKPLTEEETKELLRRGWSKNQLKINPPSKRMQLALNAGPSTPIGTNYTAGSLNQNFGAGRISNVRPKGGLTLRELLQMGHIGV